MADMDDASESLGGAFSAMLPIRCRGSFRRDNAAAFNRQSTVFQPGGAIFEDADVEVSFRSALDSLRWSEVFCQTELVPIRSKVRRLASIKPGRKRPRSKISGRYSCSFWIGPWRARQFLSPRPKNLVRIG